MDDLISRQAAIDAANDWLLDCLNVQKQDRSCGLIRRLENLPTIEPRKGKWIYSRECGTAKIWTCSECGWNDIGEFNFCPNCGADMMEENNG